MIKSFLISFVALFSLMAMSPAHAATRQELQVELNDIDNRIAEIENRITQLEAQFQQNQGGKDEPERDETSPDGEDDGGTGTYPEGGYPDDLDDLMVSLLSGDTGADEGQSDDPGADEVQSGDPGSDEGEGDGPGSDEKQSDKPEGDETSTDEESYIGNNKFLDAGGSKDLGDLMVSLQDEGSNKYTGRTTSALQKGRNLVKAFSGAKKTDQQDVKGKFVSLSKDTGTDGGVDLDKLAKSTETERTKDDQEKADTQKADQAAYDEAIKRDMQKDAETWKEEMAQSQEMLKRKMDEAKQLIADARDQGKDIVTDKEFQDKMDKIQSDYKKEKKRLDDIIRREKQAERAARKRKDQASDDQGDGSDTATEVNRILNSDPEDLDQRTIECSTTSKSGGDKPAVVTVNMKDSYGTAIFTYNMIVVKDRMIVQYGGQTLLDTGCISGGSKVPLQLTGESDQITVIVKPACEEKGTGWNFTLACPESQPQSDE